MLSSMRFLFCVILLGVSVCFCHANNKHYYIELDNNSTEVEYGVFKSDFSSRIVLGKTVLEKLDSLTLIKWLSDAISAKPKSAVLIYLHCWLGNEKNFHRASLRELTRISSAGDSTIKYSLSIIWKPIVDTYSNNWKKAYDNGKKFSPLFISLCKLLPNSSLVAHSMGHRLLQGFLSDTANAKGIKLNEVVLAAADVEHSVFTNEFKLLRNRSNRVHVLMHSNDWLLRTSSFLIGKKRLGLIGPPAEEIKGNLFVYDVTKTHTLKRPDATNHIYFVWNPYVVKSMIEIFSHKAPSGNHITVVK